MAVKKATFDCVLYEMPRRIISETGIASALTELSYKKLMKMLW
jgi:hypothetical protein